MTNEEYKALATEYYEKTVALMDKPDRTEDENFEMINLSHASCCFWTVCGTFLHIARGEWQISRVYSLLKMSDSALIHAERSLKICLTSMFRDFDLTLAYEAVARAHYLAGNYGQFFKHQILAIETAQKVADGADRAYCMNEIASIDEEEPEPVSFAAASAFLPH
ncbi:MAG: hypothetical protein LBS99_02800 [Clostridiales bacterium]|jgi:hypothetical protein|nr:hypothetical protein [Clostridiales bacterium]